MIEETGEEKKVMEVALKLGLPDNRHTSEERMVEFEHRQTYANGVELWVSTKPVAAAQMGFHGKKLWRTRLYASKNPLKGETTLTIGNQVTINNKSCIVVAWYDLEKIDSRNSQHGSQYTKS